MDEIYCEAEFMDREFEMPLGASALLHSQCQKTVRAN